MAIENQDIEEYAEDNDKHQARHGLPVLSGVLRRPVDSVLKAADRTDKVIEEVSDPEIDNWFRLHEAIGDLPPHVVGSTEESVGMVTTEEGGLPRDPKNYFGSE